MSAWYIPGGMGTPLNAAAGWTQCANNVPLVGATPGTFKSVLYDRMVPLLIEGIKEQQNQIDYLKEQLNTIVCGSLEP